MADGAVLDQIAKHIGHTGLFAGLVWLGARMRDLSVHFNVGNPDKGADYFDPFLFVMGWGLIVLGVVLLIWSLVDGSLRIWRIFMIPITADDNPASDLWVKLNAACVIMVFLLLSWWVLSAVLVFYYALEGQKIGA